MSQVTIESIDKVLKRFPNATYKEVKEALEKNNGNVVDAIIYLESNSNNSTDDNKKSSEVFGKNTEDIKNQLFDLIKKSTVIRLIIERNNKTMINIPLTVGVVGAFIGPMLTLAGLSTAVISKCKIKIANENGKVLIDLGEFSEDKFNAIKDIVYGKAKDVKQTVDKSKTKNSDHTKEEIKKEEVEEIIINLDKE